MNYQEKRRFPRAQIKADLAMVTPSFGAEVIWPSGETLEIQDLSYKGAALRRPQNLPSSMDGPVPVTVKLGIMPPFKADARVAWIKLESLGMEFASLPPEGHQAMAEYLDAKLIGGRLRNVESTKHAKNQDFSFWYQDTSGVHVFIWLDKNGQVTRTQVELSESEILDFNHGQPLSSALERGQRKALLILSQMDKPGLPMEEFLRSLAPGV